MPNRHPRRPAGGLEMEVLATLWATPNPMTPADVHSALSEDLAYTTVMTILNRLTVKGLLERERHGRAYAYRPTVTAAEHAAQKMRSALEEQPDRSAVLQRFVAGLSPRDESLLIELLDAQSGDG